MCVSRLPITFQGTWRLSPLFSVEPKKVQNQLYVMSHFENVPKRVGKNIPYRNLLKMWYLVQLPYLPSCVHVDQRSSTFHSDTNFSVQQNIKHKQLMIVRTHFSHWNWKVYLILVLFQYDLLWIYDAHSFQNLCFAVAMETSTVRPLLEVLWSLRTRTFERKDSRMKFESCEPDWITRKLELNHDSCVYDRCVWQDSFEWGNLEQIKRVSRPSLWYDNDAVANKGFKEHGHQVNSASTKNFTPRQIQNCRCWSCTPWLLKYHWQARWMWTQ